MNIKELQELIKLNNEEKRMVIKEYLKMYCFLIMKSESSKRKIVLKKLKEYIKIIKEENKLYKYIEKNISNISDYDELENMIDMLHRLNAKTFSHYDRILLECEDNIGLDCDIVPYKDFKTLLETNEYKNDVIGLTLSYNDVVSFFGDDMEDLEVDIKVLDTKEKEAMDFYGVHFDTEEDAIKSIKICVPKIRNLKTALINVHEIKHAIDLYKLVGSKYKNSNYEEVARKKEEQFVKEYLPKKWNM